MIERQSGKSVIEEKVILKNVCDLSYLTETMSGKKHLIKEVIDTFLKQVTEELDHINDAVAKADHLAIKNLAHTMKSSVSIMGISSLTPVLKKLENLGAASGDIKKITQLNLELNSNYRQAILEIEGERHKYV